MKQVNMSFYQGYKILTKHFKIYVRDRSELKIISNQNLV